MDPHDCQYKDDILSMKGDVSEVKSDIKWLVKDSKDKNGILESHITESTSYRKFVDKSIAVLGFCKYVILLLVGSGLVLQIWKAWAK